MTVTAGLEGVPDLWWCWLCNTRACTVPGAPSPTDQMLDHLAREHPVIRPTEEPTMPSKLSADRREYFERDPDPAGLPAAQIAVEHLRHCGQELLWDGTSHAGGLEDAYHRFVCANPDCYFRVSIMVHECDPTEAVIPAAPSTESAGHVPPDEAAPFGTLENHFCMTCGTRVGGPHGVNLPVRPDPAPTPEPTPDPDAPIKVAPAVRDDTPPVTREITAVKPPVRKAAAS